MGRPEPFNPNDIPFESEFESEFPFASFLPVLPNANFASFADPKTEKGLTKLYLCQLSVCLPTDAKMFWVAKSEFDSAVSESRRASWKKADSNSVMLPCGQYLIEVIWSNGSTAKAHVYLKESISTLKLSPGDNVVLGKPKIDDLCCGLSSPLYEQSATGFEASLSPSSSETLEELPLFIGLALWETDSEPKPARTMAAKYQRKIPAKRGNRNSQ